MEGENKPDGVVIAKTKARPFLQGGVVASREKSDEVVDLQNVFDRQKHQIFAKQVLRHYEGIIPNHLGQRITGWAEGQDSLLSDPIYDTEITGCKDIREGIARACEACNQHIERSSVVLPDEVRSFVDGSVFPSDTEKYLAADPLFLSSMLADIDRHITSGVVGRDSVVGQVFSEVVKDLLEKVSGVLRPYVYQLVETKQKQMLCYTFASVEKGQFDFLGDFSGYSNFREARDLGLRINGEVGDFFLTSASGVKAKVFEDAGDFCGSLTRNCQIIIKGNTGHSLGLGSERCFFEVSGKSSDLYFASGAKESIFVVGQLDKDKVVETQSNCLFLIEESSDGRAYVVFSGKDYKERREFEVDKEKYHVIKKAIEDLMDQSSEEIIVTLKAVLEGPTTSFRGRFLKRLTAALEGFLKQGEKRPLFDPRREISVSEGELTNEKVKRLRENNQALEALITEGHGGGRHVEYWSFLAEVASGFKSMGLDYDIDITDHDIEAIKQELERCRQPGYWARFIQTVASLMVLQSDYERDFEIEITDQNKEAIKQDLEKLRKKGNWLDFTKTASALKIVLPDFKIDITDQNKEAIKQELESLREKRDWLGFAKIVSALKIVQPNYDIGITDNDKKEMKKDLKRSERSTFGWEFPQMAFCLAVLSATSITLNSQGLHLSFGPTKVVETISERPQIL